MRWQPAPSTATASASRGTRPRSLQGHGRIATVKAAIWRSSPEKVLGAGAQWAPDNPEALGGAAARSLPRRRNGAATRPIARELAQILSGKAYLARPAEWMLHGLVGTARRRRGDVRRVDDFFVPFAKAATFPWKSHALWFYSQMVRWGQVAHTPRTRAIARETYRPDLYRAALKPLGIALPVANAKVEGALQSPTPVGSAGASLTLGPDGFFDGGLFDPDQLDDYIAQPEAMIRDPGVTAVRCTNFAPVLAQLTILWSCVASARFVGSECKPIDLSSNFSHAQKWHGSCS